MLLTSNKVRAGGAETGRGLGSRGLSHDLAKLSLWGSHASGEAFTPMKDPVRLAYRHMYTQACAHPWESVSSL